MDAIVAPLEILTPPKRYAPIGHCIYCVSRSKPTDEHIIPYGLAADALVLQGASCRLCASATKRFETILMRHVWWPFRTAIGAPTRGKEKPEKFLLRRMRVTKRHESGMIDYEPLGESSLSPSEFPLFYMAFKFPPPAVLIGRNLDADVNYDIWVKLNEDDMKKHAGGDQHGFRLAPGEPVAFSRLLAKIAHSYAVAELGEHAFQPRLKKIIRKEPRSLTKILNWVGGDLEIPYAQPVLHSLQLERRQIGPIHYVVVNIRLFCFMGSPQYRVVVGELIRPEIERPSLNQPPYNIEVRNMPIPPPPYPPPASASASP
jgi:hypothetical protein